MYCHRYLADVMVKHIRVVVAVGKLKIVVKRTVAIFSRYIDNIQVKCIDFQLTSLSKGRLSGQHAVRSGM